MFFKKLLIVATLLIAVTSSADQQWEKISDIDGIITYRKEIPDSPIVAFRGEADVNAPIAKVANILMDTPKKMEWVSNIMEARNLELTSNVERVEYNKTHTPWPVSNRDFVFNAKMETDIPNKKLRFYMKSVTHPSMPETKAVRGHMTGVYILTALDGGKTHLEVEIVADPKGAIPKWLVNLMQKKWPRKTIAGIREQAAKSSVVEDAGVKALMAGLTMEQGQRVIEAHKGGKNLDEAIAAEKGAIAAAAVAESEKVAAAEKAKAKEEAAKNKKKAKKSVH